MTTPRPSIIRQLLLATTGLCLVAPAAGAQSCTSSTCSIPVGNRATPFSSVLTTSLPLAFTNNANFNVTSAPGDSLLTALRFITSGGDGAPSSSQPAGDGRPASTLQFGNGGTISHILPPGLSNQLPIALLTVYGASAGGNGGDYTNSNAKHDAGQAAAGAAASMTNGETITVTGASLAGGFSINSGAALLVESLGGNGGNVQREQNLDENNNPKYDGHDGHSGAAAGTASLTNTGNVNANLNQSTVAMWYWGVAARSLGGAAGTGNQGRDGGAAAAANVTHSGDVSVTFGWAAQPAQPSAPPPPPAPPPAALGGFAVAAISQGGNGTMSVKSGSNGGTGGSAGDAVLRVTGEARPITIRINTTNPGNLASTPYSAGLAALSLGGAGGAGYDSSQGGVGGQGGLPSLTVDPGVTILATGDRTRGVFALSQGGDGGGSGVGQNGGRAWTGGSTAPADPSYNFITLTNTVISTTGQLSAGVMAMTQGGQGGRGEDYLKTNFIDTARGGIGGNGGVGSTLGVSISGGSITTSGAQSPGLMVLAQGGAGGRGGDVASGLSAADSGSGGNGGGTGGVTVTLNGTASIATTGATPSGGQPSHGIFAAATAGAGGTGGAAVSSFDVGRGNGGAGGSTGVVTITLGSGVRVSTGGDGAAAVLGRSQAGRGGNAYRDSTALSGSGGTGGMGGTGGPITITSGATLTTTGQVAHGIIAQSAGGAGGTGAAGTGFDGKGANGGTSGGAGQVQVVNSGAISVSGFASLGIQAQALGASGGAGGDADGIFYSSGGNGGVGSDGGAVTVQHSGSIRTGGLLGIGILAHSVGGGGGNAGGASSLVISVGGTGGTGGAGGAVTASLTGGSITTAGRLGHGMLLQSIGGGGGNAGDANSTGLFYTMAVGGSGSASGAGGSVTLSTNGGTVTTTASNAIGVLAQSIGGGGGSAGSAYSTSVGVSVSGAAAIGGTGGSGGAGGNVTLNLSGLALSTGQGTQANTNLNPVDSYGIHAQSIGGGGGVGGSALAQAVSVILPIPSDVPGLGASLSVALGGAGGAAGHGGAVALTLNGNSRVTTQGQGAHGALLQSIGGGGGAGGDSSAMATTVGYGRASGQADQSSFSLNIGVSLGGSGTSGGSGGTISATVENASVTTYGDFANAVLAQSIGGGGGNGGVGAASTASNGVDTSFNLAVGLGGSAGAGGSGSDVTLTLGTGGTIQSFGASAIGLLGQSIGGGGGTGQGGISGLGLPGDRGANVKVGTSGGGGGNGGSVTATLLGSITTRGSDSPALMLQSIGGGGGVGGSAGAEASADNPIDPVTGLRYIITSLTGEEPEFPTSQAWNVSVGGSGGNGGNGGQVTYSHGSRLATGGDWSHGVVLQSIGGGGGTGGTAQALSSNLGIAANLALGGSGGAGGMGGAINITLSAGSTISTGSAATATTPATGYAAFGLLAQSIGGGGGTAAEGSIASRMTLSLGASARLGGGAGQDGGAVALGGSANIRTLGDVGVGVVLQSIGAGGGVGGGGTSFTGALGPFSGTTTIHLGSSNGASGNGGPVSVNNAALTITTAGAHAYGLLAQSIGGGGGFGFSNAPTMSVVNSTGATASNGTQAGNGGAVTLNLQGGAITTTGFAAHGIVAQSISGGGGIAGLPMSPATLTLGGGGTGAMPGGYGGMVQIKSSTPITTSGTAAHGIVAQSIGGGGGLTAQGGVLFAGSSSSGLPGAQGGAGLVDIVQSAPITVSGANAIGVFAQANGPQQFSTTQVNVWVQASIRGGSGATGWGIWTDTTGFADETQAEIQVDAGASVSALSGQAIRMTGGAGNNVVYNFGTVTGSYNLGSTGSFLNQTGGTLNAGPSLDAALLANSGTVLIASHAAFGVSAVSGAFVQRGSGRLLLDADFSNRRSDVMTVAGGADLGGRVRPLISSVLPNVELPFLVVNGPVTGALEGDRSAVFAYDVNRKGGSFSVSARADFTPAGYGLSRNIAAVAGHMQAAWDAGGAGLGPLFALLGNTADAGGEGAYNAALRQVSPNGGLAPGARLAAGARGFANAAMSCPQFQGSTAMLTEGECVWAGLTGRTSAQAASDGLSSFRLNTTTWQAGGQRALGGGWFLGGSIAYEASRLTTTEGLNGGRGQAGHAAITTKYQTGPWLLAGAVFGGGGEFNGSRTITLPGFAGIARGSPSLAHAGAMLRATYTLGGEEFYLRPSMTLSLVHARSGAYRESGAGVLNLEVASASSTVGALTPALEVGGRAMLANGMVLRLYTSAGVSLLSQGRWNQESRLVSAAAEAGRFSSTVRTDQVVGRVAAGVQAFMTDRLELRLQYEGEYSQNLTGHGGSVAIAWRF
jgi:hypothetical protein